MAVHETFYEVMRKHGITRRSFLKFCSLTAAGLGLGPEFAGKIAHAMETKPRTPVIWLHGQECTCCTESFIRSGHPLAGDAILSMISLDYDDTIMAAQGIRRRKSSSRPSRNTTDSTSWPARAIPPWPRTACTACRQDVRTSIN